MLSKALEEIMLEKKEILMVDANNVANLMVNNPLNHALLVLSQVRFSRIPVLGKNDHFVGTVGLAEVVDKIIETQGNENVNLEDFTVEDVVDVKQPTLTPDWKLEDAMRLLKDYNFIPIVDEGKFFKGILTRKGLLSVINYTFHEFDRRHLSIPREGGVVS